ncbi:Low temperature requirement B protein [Pediococcus damnosus]|uniref:Low temperature requirement B protein n=1 Tax=Pediococcus damnosus TaxID=51663 RepID=A0AAC9FIP5_9LACO|nr:Low temperature requirement B protein [Pediococcus damnosus]KJU74223.1 sugar transporter [Pediococcus damnosus LMG 28219]AMV62685.1 Low temperature requirement B protein [Pediococcus damnosus]AMV64409.1 Low temperature requirement B protein [Pediococcus damnosus]AMV67430.1 Low temperature requirement B protein [Pediococcus damnosus]
MQNKKMKNAMQGAFILTFASLVAKVLSAVYRIPLQNLVGNTGFYVYQQIYPIYGIGITFALSGFPVFVSKLIAEQETEIQKVKIARRAFVILSGISLVIVISLLSFAPEIAGGMGDAGLTPLIRCVSLMFIFMPFLAVGRGYYQGIFQMIPTARSQVMEQVVRVAIIIGVAYTAASQNWNVYRMGTWAMSGAVVAAIVSTLYFLRLFRKKIFAPLPSQAGVSLEPVTSYSKLGKRFLIEGGTICLFAAIIILLQLIDSFTVKNGLVASGVSNGNAKALKGIYDRAQPLVQLGLVVATSFSTTLLPTLTKAVQKHNRYEFKRTVQSMLHISLAISVAATVGMITLLPQINRLLFGNTEGTSAIMIYVIAVILAALIATYNSVLQSVNVFRPAILAFFTGLGVKLVFNRLAVTKYGINGASLVTVLSLAVILICMQIGSPDSLKDNLKLDWRFFAKLVLASGSMALVVNWSKLVLLGLFPDVGRIELGIIVVAVVLLGGLTFIGVAIGVRLFTIREWLTIPYGKKLLKKIVR